MTLPDKARRHQIRQELPGDSIPEEWAQITVPRAMLFALLDAADRLEHIEIMLAETDRALADMVADCQREDTEAIEAVAQAAAMRAAVERWLVASDDRGTRLLLEQSLDGDTGRALLERMRSMEAALRLVRDADPDHRRDCPADPCTCGLTAADLAVEEALR